MLIKNYYFLVSIASLLNKLMNTMNIEPSYSYSDESKKSFNYARQIFCDEPLMKQLVTLQPKSFTETTLNFQRLPTLQLEQFKKKFIESYKKTYETKGRNIINLMDIDECPAEYNINVNTEEIKSKLHEKFKRERANYYNQSKRVESNIVIHASCDCFNSKS